MVSLPKPTTLNGATGKPMTDEVDMMRTRTAIQIAGFVLLGVVLAMPAALAPRAEAAPQGEYSGPKLCQACHQGTHPEIISKQAQSAHAGAMWPVEDEGGKNRILGDFSSSPPFPKDKIAYVLGTGRKYQSYIGADLRVLPAEWSVEKGSWRPREVVDATRDCLGCHTTGFDPKTQKWVAPGVTCEMCHGPGAAHVGSQDKKSTIVRLSTLAPERKAMVCGQCHASGRSKDGAFAFPVGYRPGDDLTAHFTLDATVGASVLNSQYNELVQGGKHMAAGTVCTTCHGAHGASGSLPSQLTAPTNDLCLACHGGKLAGPQHEPAALNSITCDACHMPGGKHTFAAPGR